VHMCEHEYVFKYTKSEVVVCLSVRACFFFFYSIHLCLFVIDDVGVRQTARTSCEVTGQVTLRSF
jgi:hypothetical protein